MIGQPVALRCLRTGWPWSVGASWLETHNRMPSVPCAVAGCPSMWYQLLQAPTKCLCRVSWTPTAKQPAAWNCCMSKVWRERLVPVLWEDDKFKVKTFAVATMISITCESTGDLYWGTYSSARWRGSSCGKASGEMRHSIELPDSLGVKGLFRSICSRYQTHWSAIRCSGLSSHFIQSLLSSAPSGCREACRATVSASSFHGSPACAFTWYQCSRPSPWRPCKAAHHGAGLLVVLGPARKPALMESKWKKKWTSQVLKTCQT